MRKKKRGLSALPVGEEFALALAEDFERRGSVAIAEARKKDPEGYAAAMEFIAASPEGKAAAAGNERIRKNMLRAIKMIRGASTVH